MHIAVCDDHIDERSLISALLEDYRRERGCAITYETFHSATELLAAMGKRQFDLLLLDILMPGISGLEAAREIRRWDGEVSIIFLTSSREFAVESYSVNASDYIVKPLRTKAIFAGLDKQLANIAQRGASLTLKTKNGLVMLSLSQIVCVEVLYRRVQFTLITGEVREVYGYLSDYESVLLSNPSFYKPRRSYIVNLQHVTGLSRDGFATIVGKTIPVARDIFAKTKAAYIQYLLTGEGFVI